MMIQVVECINIHPCRGVYVFLYSAFGDIPAHKVLDIVISYYIPKFNLFVE
jgi:hypothetical protein